MNQRIAQEKSAQNQQFEKRFNRARGGFLRVVRELEGNLCQSPSGSNPKRNVWNQRPHNPKL
jgi:hypothetical protein